MGIATKKCKVCGRDYEYCKTNKSEVSKFRWQDVACCPEHAAIYFAEIAKSRGESIENIPSTNDTPADTENKQGKKKTSKRKKSDSTAE